MSIDSVSVSILLVEEQKRKWLFSYFLCIEKTGGLCRNHRFPIGNNAYILQNGNIVRKSQKTKCLCLQA